MDGEITVVIADDQTLMREGLQIILNLEDDMSVVATAENGERALEAVQIHKPRLVLMDIQMPVMDGIEATRRIKQICPNTTVLILSTFAEEDYIVEALSLGAAGFLLKDMPGDKLIQAIRDCMTGQLMMPAVIAAKLAARLASSSPLTRQESNVKRLKAEGLRLSEREKQIAVMMMQGNTNRQIAEQLFMSEGTVKNYISVIYGKIGISDRTKAILVLKELHTDHEAINSGG